jgi:hypothetical protein
VIPTSHAASGAGDGEVAVAEGRPNKKDNTAAVNGGPEMSSEISMLEQAWLQAETIADKARYEAMALDEVLEAKRTAVKDETEILVLTTTVEKAKAKHKRAEQMAAETFDRLWQAKSQGQMNA